MKRFAELYGQLDATTSTKAKVQAMAQYFRQAHPRDGAWAVYFLTGQRLKRLLPTRSLRHWGAELAEIPDWLFEESYANVGDLAETLALLVEGAPSRESSLDSPASLAMSPLHRWVEQELLPLRRQPEDQQRDQVLSWWRSLPQDQIFLLNKMMTGGLRVGVSKNLVVRALAEVADLPRAVITHRLMGSWQPTGEGFEALLTQDTEDADLSRPYPFFLAHPIEGDPGEQLGSLEDWQLEWKWDGIRGQLLARGGEVFLWSRGEELVTERFPEIAEAARWLPPGSALDGEILAWQDGAPLPFASLQRRIGRKRLGPKILAEAPVIFLAYDFLEQGSKDLRAAPLAQRRGDLEALMEGAPEQLQLSPRLSASSWEEAAEERASARDRGVEGLMIKQLCAAYGVGRQRGAWWKWKLDPYTVDAVLIYAQAGHGRRATLFTDYTLAVWRGEELIPVAKAYSGLSNDEIRALDRWIRRHTRERFGPVRSVEPVHVFEIAFEGIARSRRHKSGVALRFPRILRWRQDKKPQEADSLGALEALLPSA